MGLSQAWRMFRDGEPGRRFVEEHDRMESSWPARIGVAGLGILLISGGIVMLFIPGPGILAILLGTALVATTWRRLAKWMDIGEIRIRAWGRER